MHEPPGARMGAVSAIWLLLLAHELPKQKSLARGRVGDFPEASLQRCYAALSSARSGIKP